MRKRYGGSMRLGKVILAAGCSAALVGVSLVGTQATAGGLAVREQSSQFQGSSFAGAAAGGGLSSAFWNSAAIGEAGKGMQTENHAALIFGETDYTSLDVTG